MARLFYNNAFGTIDFPGLTASGTTITFTSAPPFSTIASPDFIPIVIEPPQSSIAPSARFEIVYLTAFTAGATSGTITRGQEGTSGVVHNAGMAWVAAPTAYDAFPMTMNYAVFTSSGTWNIPPGVTQALIRAIGGGGSGSGGDGGAVTTSGGGGGSAGSVSQSLVVFSGDTALTITIGTGGTGGTGGSSGGSGSIGTNPTATTVVGATSATAYITGARGYRALGSGSSYHGGRYGGTGVDAGVTGGLEQAGDGGNGQSGAPGDSSGQPFICVVGGGGGGGGGANGGGGGHAQGTGALAVRTGGAQGGNSVNAGGAGVSATRPGCGGGGGGGAATGSLVSGGAGGDGASGQVEIWW